MKPKRIKSRPRNKHDEEMQVLCAILREAIGKRKLVKGRDRASFLDKGIKCESIGQILLYLGL